jgi:hypothetical protein
MRFYAQLRIVIALVALTVCGAALAAPTGKLWVKYGGRIVEIQADTEYTQAHPGQAGLQAVASDNRRRIGEAEERLDTHDEDISNLSGRVKKLENTSASPTPTTLPAAPATTPGALLPGPPSVPAGGGATLQPPPVNPADRRAPMSPWNYFWMFLIAAGLVVGAIALFMYLPVAFRRRRMEDNVEVGQLRRELNTAVVDETTNAVQRARQIAEQSRLPQVAMTGRITDAYGNTVATVGTERTEDGFFRQLALAGPGGGAPATPAVTGRELTAAVASLARPTSAVPAGTAPVAAPRVIAFSIDKRDRLAEALVGLTALTDAMVDLVRDNLIQTGQIAP